MRLRTLGAVCASCAVAASTSTAVAQAPAPGPDAGGHAARHAPRRPAPPAAKRAADRAPHVHGAQGSPRCAATRSRAPSAAASASRCTASRCRGCACANRRVARDVREARATSASAATAARPNVPIPAVLASIAQCESHGNPRAISPGGTYRGKYQFSFSTWASVGGKGDPAAASETEQDRRAAILYRTGGPGHWPVCGR